MTEHHDRTEHHDNTEHHDGTGYHDDQREPFGVGLDHPARHSACGGDPVSPRAGQVNRPAHGDGPAPVGGPPGGPGPLLGVRAAVVFVVALVIGIAAGVLTYLAGDSVPAAVLAGAAATGTAVALFHRIVGPR